MPESYLEALGSVFLFDPLVVKPVEASGRGHVPIYLG